MSNVRSIITSHNTRIIRKSQSQNISTAQTTVTVGASMQAMHVYCRTIPRARTLYTKQPSTQAVLRTQSTLLIHLRSDTGIILHLSYTKNIQT